jgi:hypothetical protein
MRRSTIIVPALSLLVPSACSGAAADGPSMSSTVPSPTSLVTVPAATSGPSFVVADVDGRVGVIEADGTDRQLRDDAWERLVSLDGTYAVSTVLVGPGDTEVAWDDLASGEVLGGAMLAGVDMVAAATQAGGHLTALVNRASEPVDGAIAGGRTVTSVTLASPDDGKSASYELTGNFVPEAIGSTLRPDGLPAQLFLLEYLPADAPTRYRVQVLDTATGELHLPLNLRDKLGPRVDQEMAGVTRGQVLADEHGLLFTLYRGTSDMPDGHPYAFVHTLDLFDGVWCLPIPEQLHLEQLPGALAVGGDRLYVASANGRVGAFDIGEIREPQGRVEMLWVVELPNAGGRGRPAIAAGPDGAVVAFPSMSGLHRVAPDGTVLDSTVFDDRTEAIAVVDGATYAVGDAWMLPGERPDWLGEVTRLHPLP